MNSKMATIDCLPPEIMCEILSNLNLDQLINCKLVCKKWYLIVTQSIKLTKLVVNNDYVFDRERWYYSNERIQDQHYCVPNLFLTHLNKKILSNLKQLKINVDSSFDLNRLNLFKNLIQLEIIFFLDDYDDDQILNLPNLEVLSLDFENGCCEISIQCPKLQIVCYRDVDDDLIEVKYPTTIRFLDSNSFDANLAQFTNIEHLRVDFLSLISYKGDLRTFKTLKEIRCDHDYKFKNFLDNIYGFETNRVKPKLKNLLNSTENSTAIDLYCFGLKLTKNNIDKLSLNFGPAITAFPLTQEVTYFLISNYELLQDNSLSFVVEVDYSVLMSLVDKVPNDYFTKFSRINKVNASKSIDQDHFLWFLKNLKYLNRLVLSGTNLNQSFYDELPKFCSLNYFHCSNQEKQPELNFEFIAKFVDLKYLGIFIKELSLKSVRSLIDSYKSLKNYPSKLIFQFKEKQCHIKKDSTIECWVDNYKNKVKLGSTDELIDYLEKL